MAKILAFPAAKQPEEEEQCGMCVVCRVNGCKCITCANGPHGCCQQHEDIICPAIFCPYYIKGGLK